MPYYIIHVNLTQYQKDRLIYAIHNRIGCSLRIAKGQIGDPTGDRILVTEAQYKRLSSAQDKPITINFPKSQIEHMTSQIGLGILDSIGGFFKNAVSGVKNWWTGANKKPVQVEMQHIPKMDKLKNKANAFFDDNRAPNVKHHFTEPKEPKMENFMKTFKEHKDKPSTPLKIEPLKYTPATKPIKQPKKPMAPIGIIRNGRKSNLSQTLDSGYDAISNFINNIKF